MKNFVKVMVMVAMAALAACSDGAIHRAADVPAPSDNTPKINAFTVKNAKDAAAKDGKSAEIDANGSVIITWDVSGAKSVEIKDSKGKDASGNNSGLTGKSHVDAIAADESYVLTAYGSDGSSQQDRVTVKIRKKDIKVTFTATPAQIRSGDSSQLCWVVSDSYATVSVKDGKGTEIFPGNTVPESLDQPAVDTYATDPAQIASTDSTVAKAMRFLLKSAAISPQAPADGYATTTPVDMYGQELDPATGLPVCVTVIPAESTTYTITVKDGDTVAATQDAKVDVTAAPQVAIASFEARTADNGDTTLSWTVTPEDATVSIDNGAGEGLPSTGNVTVRPKETTTYTLTATGKDGSAAQKTVIVIVKRAARPAVVATSASVYEGEAAQIVISQGDVAGTVTVLDQAGNAVESSVNSGVVTIANPAVGGSYIVSIDGEPSNAVAIEVRQLSQRSSVGSYGVATSVDKTIAGPTGSSVERIVTSNLDGNGSSSNGASFKLFAQLTELKGSILDVSSNNKVDVGSGIASRIHPDFGKSGQMKFFEPYAVRAVAFDKQDSSRVFFGTTGGLFMSTDGGSSWKIVDVLPIFDNAHKFTSAETHAGCDGSKQTGIPYSASNGALVDFIQICDIVADGTSVVLATDQGTFHIDNVDARLDASKRKANPWKVGIKGKVVNRLSLVKSGEQSVLVAAASDGVYINSSADAAAWQQLVAADLFSSVNAVAVSGSTILAGTDSGLYAYSDISDANGKWSAVAGLVGESVTDSYGTTTTGTVAVKALAVDSNDASIVYVGTDEGLKISRDCGNNFVNVRAAVGSVKNIATASNGSRSAIVIASNKGLFSSVGSTGKGSSSCVVPLKLPTATVPVDATEPGTVAP